MPQAFLMKLSSDKRHWTSLVIHYIGSELSHYLGQSWPSSVSPYVVTRPWVNGTPRNKLKWNLISNYFFKENALKCRLQVSTILKFRCGSRFLDLTIYNFKNVMEQNIWEKFKFQKNFKWYIYFCMSLINSVTWYFRCVIIEGTLGCVFIDNETHSSGVTKCTTGEAWSAFSWHHSSVFHCQWTHNQVFLLLSHMLI